MRIATYKIKAQLHKHPPAFGKFGEIRVFVKTPTNTSRWQKILTQRIDKLENKARLELEEPLWAKLPARVQAMIYHIVDDMDPTNSYPYTEIHSYVEIEWNNVLI